MNRAAPEPKANMGQPAPRYESRLKVTGQARYASDVPVRNPAYGYLVTSGIAKGRIVAMDERAARAVPGVLLVMTHANRPAIAQPLKFFFGGGVGLTSVPPLGDDRVRHDGDIVAFVVADTYEAAREAAYRLDVRYESEPAAATFGSAGVEELETAKLIPMRKDPRLGDADAALAGATHVIDAEYSTPTQHHNPIELFATTCTWEGDRLTIYEPSQFVYGLRKGMAEQLGIPPERVHVVNEFVGGAFGSKGAVGQRSILTALAARELGRPVKTVLTRSQGFTQAGYRQETKHRIRLGCDAQGKLVGYQHDLWELTARTDPYCNGGVENAVAMYDFPAVRSTGRLVRADRNVPVFMRSPPEMPVIYALECAMDELAAKAGVDPVEFRRRNDTLKNTVTGKPYTTRSVMRCFDEAAQAFGWTKRNPKPGSMRDGDWLVGYGTALATYPTSTASCVARVRLEPDGATLVEIAAHDVGTGAYTVYAQMAAECLGVPLERVTVRMGDSALPPGPLSGGSISTGSGCSAIKLACERLLGDLQLRAGAGAKEREAAFAKRGVGALEATGDYVPVGAKQPTTASAYRATPDFVGGVHAPKTMFAFGAEFVEVRVHARTREIRVPRIVGAFAAGRIMNTRTARSQLMGGMIWGIGSALHEFTEIDRRAARYVNHDLAEYLIPVNADIRECEVILVPETDTEANPAGVKGIGELANVGTAAAIANAVFHATGKRVRDLPITIEKLI